MPHTPDKNIARALSTSPCFAGLSQSALGVVAEAAVAARFEAGQFLLREGQAADRFFVLLQGRVAIELRSSNRGQVIIQTLEEGDVVGLSWLHPPQRWIFDAQALTFIDALSIDADAIMAACRLDPALGLDLMHRFAGCAIDQLQAARLQLLEFYGVKG